MSDRFIDYQFLNYFVIVQSRDLFFALCKQTAGSTYPTSGQCFLSIPPEIPFQGV